MDIAAPEPRRRAPVAGFQKGNSGNPHGKAWIRVRAAELFAEMAVDFGTLGAVETVLLRRAALLLARSERIRSSRDADVSLRMSSEARRTLMTLRRHHAAVPTSPAEAYADIAARAQAEASQRREQELAEDETPAEEVRTTDLPEGNGGHPSDERADDEGAGA
jgi:hypothetical protein